MARVNSILHFALTVTMKIYPGSGDRMEIKMNRFASAIGISLIALSSLTGVAHAKMWPGADIEQSHLDSAVQALKNKKFIIVQIDTLDSSDPMSKPETYSSNIASLQNAISKNKTLTAELKAQNVELNNVVAVDEAADGGFTFYLR